MTMGSVNSVKQVSIFTSLRNVLADIASRPSGALGLSLVSFHIVLAVVSPAIIPYDFKAMDAQLILIGPSAEHWLGTDNLGRDILSRTMLGGRQALMVTSVATVMAIAWGGMLGVLLGLIGGWLEGEARFGPGGTNEVAFSTQAGSDGDGIVAAYDADGQFAWVRRIGGPGRQQTGAVVVSDDGGQTWAQGSPLPGAPVNAMAVSGDGTVLVVGTGTGAFMSRDSGGTWERILEAPTVAVAVDEDATIAFLVAEGGEVFRYHQD